jgi:hypothetical protein
MRYDRVGSQELSFRGKALDHWLCLRISGEDEARWEAIDAIRHICRPDVSIPLFLDTLHNDSYWRARALAAHALYDLAFESEYRPRLLEILPSLRNALVDSSIEVRENVNNLLELLEQGPAG